MHIRPFTPLLALITLSACSGFSHEMGVTPGGMQDIDFARDLIEAGMIPSAETFTTEGLFSQHDLPIDGEPCAELLCPRASAAVVRPVDAAQSQYLVQLGFDTDIDPETFERATLDLAVAIDISGSMAGDKLQTAKQSLHALIDQLDGSDRLSLVTFGSTAVVEAPLTTMDAAGREALHDAVDALRDGGSTAMEDGLVGAIASLDDRRQDVSARVFLITDAQPNVGGTSPDAFTSIAADAADDEIGVTVWGVGLDLGAALTEALAEVRGANAWFFSDTQTMAQRVAEEFAFIVTPVAYDLEVVVQPEADLHLARPWGAPTDEASQQVEFGASTLFLSTRAGGMGVTLDVASPIALDLDQPRSLAEMQLQWTPVGETSPVQSSLVVDYDGGEAHSDGITHADQEGVFRMSTLVDEVLALEAGAAWCRGEIDQQEAQSRISEVTTRLEIRVVEHQDEALAPEAELMAKLLDNLKKGLSACY